MVHTETAVGFQVLSTILCEDVRREASGQLTIVGASPVGPSLPASGGRIGKLSIFLEIIVANVTEMKVRLIGDSAKEPVFLDVMSLPVDQHLQDEIDEGEDWEIHTVMILKKDGIEVREPGSYALQIQVTAEPWKTVRDIWFPSESD